MTNTPIFYLGCVLWLYITLAILAVILFFPIWIRVELLYIDGEDTEVTVRLWRWVIWKYKPEPEPEAEADHSVSPPVHPVASTTPIESAPTTEARAAEPAHEEKPAEQHEEKPAEPQDEKSAEQSSDRALVALGLNPVLQKEAFHLAKRFIVSIWRIFKIRIPKLRIHYGHENPAQMGWMAGGFWGASGMFEMSEGWEFIPVWHRPGLSAAHTEIKITITVFRILRFLFGSLFRLARFAWIGWKLYKAYKADPAQMALAPWRRWILNQISPLVAEVQNDKT